MKVSDLIESRKEVFSVSDTATVYDAARYLRDKQVRAVGVCNAEDKLVGIISQSDISDKTAAENKCPAWMRVSEIMSTGLIRVGPETPLDECLWLMEKHKIFHLAVEDDKTGFRGLMSVQDLLRVIATDEKARADMLEAYIFPNR
jgi:CBS domain-containing protein